MASVDTQVRLKRRKQTNTVAASIAAISTDVAKHLIAMTPPPPSIMERNGRLLLTSRLPSLNPPRDLTLGGRNPPRPAVSTSKKAFVPNLNAVRNKNTVVKTSRDTTRGGRGSRGGTGSPRGGARGRGGTASTSLIQTTGLFSEGAGAMHVRKSSGGHTPSYSRSEGETAAQMRRPTYVKGDDRKVDLTEEASQLHSLLGDDADHELGTGKTPLAADCFPIKLNADSVAIAKELQRMHVQQAEQMQRHNTQYPSSIPEFLATTQQKLFLLQLPDMLPSEIEDSPSTASRDDPKNVAAAVVKPVTTPTLSSPGTDAAPTTDPAATPQSSGATPESESASSQTQASTVSALAATPRFQSQSMKAMQEGQIGKLVRYKSGKTKLVLGQTTFDLELGMETGFLQHLMSIKTNAEERSGDMINLGNLSAKITATPDWDHLLQCSM